MDFLFKIIRKEELNTTTWSGGTTTQLAIYPEDALYSERNFLWRISTARIETEESTFTTLHNIHRIIMVLEGSMRLCHEGNGELFMEPFHQKSFMGDWITKSYGRVTDFNLMTTKESEGYLDVIKISPISNFESALFTTLNDCDFEYLAEVYYFITPVKAVLLNNEYTDFKYGDVLIVQSKTDNNSAGTIDFFNPLMVEGQIIKACICFNTLDKQKW